jgi:hypothetical protein
VKGSGCYDLAASHLVELHQFIDCSVEVVAEFLVGHPVDLPSDAPRIAVTTFVALTVQPPSVPGHMVDLNGPANQWVCSIWMDRDSVWKVERMLAYQGADASLFQGVEHTNLET